MGKELLIFRDIVVGSDEFGYEKSCFLCSFSGHRSFYPCVLRDLDTDFKVSRLFLCVRCYDNYLDGVLDDLVFLGYAQLVGRSGGMVKFHCFDCMGWYDEKRSPFYYRFYTGYQCLSKGLYNNYCARCSDAVRKFGFYYGESNIRHIEGMDFERWVELYCALDDGYVVLYGYGDLSVSDIFLLDRCVDSIDARKYEFIFGGESRHVKHIGAGFCWFCFRESSCVFSVPLSLNDRLRMCNECFDYLLNVEIDRGCVRRKNWALP